MLLLTLPLLTRCLPWDERLAACHDAGLCDGAAGGAAAGGSGGAGGGATAGGSGGTGGGTAGTGGGATAGGSGGGAAPVARFTVTPSPLNFSSVEQNTTRDLPLTITNTGEVMLATPTADPENQLLFSVQNACSGPLAPDAGCVLTIRYAPILVAQDDKKLTVSAAPAPDVLIHTLGTSTPPGVRYAAMPGGLDFGPVVVATPSAVQQVTFRNTGTPQVTLSSVTLEDTVGAADDFSIVANGCSAGATFANDAGCTVTLRFTPRSEGPLDARLHFTPNSLPDAVVTLDGAGVALTSLTVGRTGLISDGGRIFTDDGGIDCPGRCTHVAPRGTAVTLHAGALNGLAHFVEWAAACPAGGPDCTLSMSADASTASARFDPYNRVFLAGPTNGAFKAGANLCAAAAMSAGLTRAGTSWVYGVNDSSGTLVSALGSSRGWVRTDGQPFADLPADIVNGRVMTPPMLDGIGAVKNEGLWSGFDMYDGGVATSNCLNWTASDTSNYGAQGYSLNEGTWFMNSGPRCDSTAWVLCLEVGGRAPLVVPPRPGGTRLAFVSAGSVNGNTSAAMANMLCNGEAGTTNTFVAMRGTDTVGARSLVSTTAGTWYRADNVKLFPQANELTYSTRTQLAGISRQLDGGIVPPGTQVWTGGDPSVPSSTATNCTNWGTTAGLGVVGVTHFVSGASFQLGNLGCGNPARVYCFER
ncbi:MAG: choice-of-anchor D domain-containing protein [Archangiaceae bacterium]|nr:choice-of-anchor D domain-containing protein [Archangiaceae bacterium]